MKPFEGWLDPSKGGCMIRLDAYYFYRVGVALHPLSDVHHNMKRVELYGKLYSAESWLDALLTQHLVRIKTSWPKGKELLTTIRNTQKLFKDLSAEEWEKPIGFRIAYDLTSQVEAFENVLSAEISFSDIYVVSKKGGFDTTELAENGIILFPTELSTKVPEAISDAHEAARCIAFDLPTAAAFHLHRMNELVLRRYYDSVTNGAERPISRNIGAYIDALKNNQIQDKKLFGALATLKDFHRNPVLHPDDRLDSVEDAISLLGAVRTVIAYMLKALPPPALVLEASPNEQRQIEETRT